MKKQTSLLLSVALYVATACSAGDASTNVLADASLDSGGHEQLDASIDGSVDAACSEPRLFGAPTEATGLSNDECGPSCACSGLRAPEFSGAQIELMANATYLGERTEIVADPYESGSSDSPPEPGRACGVVLVDEGYRLESFASVEELERSGV